MRVRIIKISASQQVDALIRRGKIAKLPSMQQGWRFNFNIKLKKLSGATGYILVTEEMPDVVEAA